MNILNLYKDKIKSLKVEELIALNHLLVGNFSSSLKSVKKNIMMDPSNIKHRFQLSYVTERKVEKFYQEEKNKQKV